MVGGKAHQITNPSPLLTAIANLSTCNEAVETRLKFPTFQTMLGVFDKISSAAVKYPADKSHFFEETRLKRSLASEITSPVDICDLISI